MTPMLMRHTFYAAHALRPETGKVYDLNLSTEREDRISSVVDFRIDPSGSNARQIETRVW